MSKRFLLAGALAAVASATHITGIFVIVLLMLLLIEEKVAFYWVLLTGTIGSFGILAYMAYLWKYFHNPLEFISAQKDHHWLEHYFWSNLTTVSRYDIAFMVLVTVTTLYWWSRKKSFSVYTALFLLIPLVGGQFGGYPRYCLMAFPIQIMLCDYFKDRTFGRLVTISLLAVIWAYTVAQFSLGYAIA